MSGHPGINPTISQRDADVSERPGLSQIRINGYNIARRSSLASADDGLSNQGSPLSRSVSNSQGWGIWSNTGLSSNPIKSPLGDLDNPLAKSPPFESQFSPRMFPQDAWKACCDTSFHDRRHSSATEPTYIRSGSTGGFSSSRLDEFHSEKSPLFRAIHSNGELSELPSAFRKHQPSISPSLFAMSMSQQPQQPQISQQPVGAGSPSLTLLERFSQLADATREAEILGSMKQMSISEQVHPQPHQQQHMSSQYQQHLSSYIASPVRSEVGSPSSNMGKLSPSYNRSANLSPYVSPTPSFVPLSNGFGDTSGRPDTQKQSRSSSFSNSVWQHNPLSPPEDLANGPPDQQANKVLPYFYPAVPSQDAFTYSHPAPLPEVFYPEYPDYPTSNGFSFQIPGRGTGSSVISESRTPPVRSNSGSSNQGNGGYLRHHLAQSKYSARVCEGSENGPRGPGSPVSGARKGGSNSDFSSIRSPLLEEFRNNKTKKYELRDLYGHIVEFSGDQHGSRFIQQRLETASSEEKEIIFNEIRSDSLQLMTDVFGNYVIQKFFELGNQLQKTILAKQMENHILSLSLQMYGCRVVQKAIEHVLTDQQASMIKELDGHVLKCVKDQNGNHVVQKAIERIPAEHITFIIEAFYDQVYRLAIHPYGCRVIQRMLEHCPEDAQTRLLNELHNYTYYLVEDQYGNYVIQHVVEHGKPQDRDKIVEIVKGSVLSFSRHKFASNVVEKCITYGTHVQRSQLIHEIITPCQDGTIPLTIMMKDQFANYVIQKLLETTEGENHDQLVASIRPHLQALKKYTYGKHLVSIEKLLSLSDEPAR